MEMKQSHSSDSRALGGRGGWLIRRLNQPQLLS